MSNFYLPSGKLLSLREAIALDWFPYRERWLRLRIKSGEIRTSTFGGQHHFSESNLKKDFRQYIKKTQLNGDGH